MAISLIFNVANAKAHILPSFRHDERRKRRKKKTTWNEHDQEGNDNDNDNVCGGGRGEEDRFNEININF